LRALRLLRRDLLLDLLGLHRAELEFRDLAERIERGIGQQVGRRLRVAERRDTMLSGTSRAF
jgi:hypothetical protein